MRVEQRDEVHVDDACPAGGMGGARKGGGTVEDGDRGAGRDERTARGHVTENREPRTAAALDFTDEHLLRELAPQVLGAVIRRFGDFSAAEDAVQEALLAA